MTRATPAADADRRRALITSLPFVVFAGLVGRFVLPGVAADLVGGMLYTALVYVVYAAAMPRVAPRVVAIGAFAVSAAIELFQLTGIPNELADAISPSRLILGTSFAATDLVAYALGALAALLVDTRLAPRQRQPRLRDG